MKPFNLAESRIAQRTYCQTHLNKRIRAIALLACVAFVAILLSCGANSLVARRAQKAQADLTKIQARCADIRRHTTAAQAQLDQRRWQDQLAKASDSWLSVISGVLDQLPDDVWVSRIETSPKDATLQIDGRATDYDTLSVFVDRLRRDRTFSDIRLGTVRIARIGELTCLEFTVPMKLRVGGEASQPAPDTQASAASEGGSGA